MKFEASPEKIYSQSFAKVRRDADLSRHSRCHADVAVRIIHACGMVDIGPELEFTDDFAGVACEALLRKAPIHCDGQMTAAGIIRKALPRQNEIVVTVNCPESAAAAAERNTTRSAAAVDAWLPTLAGSVVAIGNAPTALFRLLELVDAGGPAPAAVIGFPVGFVGAAESKRELLARRRRFEYVTLPGTRGGSAMASAALNALAASIGGPRAVAGGSSTSALVQ